ncbi:hypothetical protein [Aeromicrobium sp.]|uniref:hypothetical protein n=1 Tax=Aeromicrobium sp. TaxID=1871063 RepID=UPI003D6BFF29
MRLSRTLFTLAASAILVVAGIASAGTATAGKSPKPPRAAAAWAPADTAQIHPGTMMYTDGAQCTANFVFTNGTSVYVGYAAHCAGTGAATETNGCDADSLPLGTRVDFVEGGSLASGGKRVGGGTLAYSSWLAMQQRNESDQNACDYNDFAVVKVDAADVSKVNPSIPFYGGPTGIDIDGTVVGDTVYSYGNSSVRGGAEPLSPKQGSSVGDQGEGWSHDVYTATPGIPGDSGSAFIDDQGRALGTLSTVQIAPLAGSNGVSDLAKELAYAQANGQSGLTLANGTEPFAPVL